MKQKPVGGNVSEIMEGAVKVSVARPTRLSKDDPRYLLMLKDLARNGEAPPFIRQTTVLLLAKDWKDNPEVLPLLKDLAQNDKNSAVRRTALLGLARDWKDDPETLHWVKEQARLDKKNSVRQAAAEPLARGEVAKVQGSDSSAPGAAAAKTAERGKRAKG